MNRLKFASLLVLTIISGSCTTDEPISNANPEGLEEISFTVNNDYILKNNMPFPVKGIVYVPGYPGYLPWDIEKSTDLPFELKISISEDIANIKAMGANTIRFWGAPKFCYQALKNTGDLNFIQTIWIKSDEPDFHNPAFKENTKSYIREVIDRIYSVFDDTAPPLVAFIVGSELSESSILSTNTAHQGINQYIGQYITTERNVTATEAFLAEMADYTKTYEFERYNNLTLVSYANEIRTANIIDTPFLDFISHNAYSYAVPYYRPQTSPGSKSGTLFKGWLEEIKSKHPEKPLLVSETGLSVSPNADHIGAPNYGYGGNTEKEQAEGILQNIRDINSTSLPTAGVCIHEYLDAWWKFGLEDSYTQDPDDIEEWFGIVKLLGVDDWYSTETRISYISVKNNW